MGFVTMLWYTMFDMVWHMVLETILVPLVETHQRQLRGPLLEEFNN